MPIATVPCNREMLLLSIEKKLFTSTTSSSATHQTRSGRRDIQNATRSQSHANNNRSNMESIDDSRVADVFSERHGEIGFKASKEWSG